MITSEPASLDTAWAFVEHDSYLPWETGDACWCAPHVALLARRAARARDPPSRACSLTPAAPRARRLVSLARGWDRVCDFSLVPSAHVESPSELSARSGEL